MARIAEGWKLRRDPRSGIYSVRFRHRGRRYDVSTGARDAGEASAEAARIYARKVTGARQEVAHAEAPVVAIAARWLTDVARTLDESTIEGYEGYVRNHFATAFPVLSGITTASIADFMRMRLSMVLRASVQRELAGLSSFLTWCEEQGLIASVPAFPKLPRRALGTPAKRQKAAPVELTLDEVQRFLEAVPEWAGVGANRFPARARLIVAFETSLRPSTLASLRAPENYRVGASALRIDSAADKARFGRDVPLSDAARRALDSVCPAEGVIFGAHDFRHVVRRAARAAGLPSQKAEWLTPYDFRHNRIRSWLDAGAPLTGVAFQAGHKQLTTTNKYVSVRASIEAAHATVNASGGAIGRGRPANRETNREYGSEGHMTQARARGTDAHETPDKVDIPSRSERLTGGAGSGLEPPAGGLARSVVGVAYLRMVDPDAYAYALAGTLDADAGAWPPTYLMRPAGV